MPIYNAFLSLYYLLVINYGISDQKIAERAEPAMHLVAFGWAFYTAFYSAITGLLNNANLWCWIAPLPGDCLDTRRFGDEGNCTRGDNAWIYRWAFYFAPLWFCIFFASTCDCGLFRLVSVLRSERLPTRLVSLLFHNAAVCTILVYRKVQTYDRITAKYRRPVDAPIRANGASSVASEGSVSRPSTSGWRTSFSGYIVRKGNRGIHDDYDQESDDSDHGSRSRGLGQIDEREVDAYAEETEPARWDIPSTWKRWQLKRQIFREDNPRTAEVFQQALWYLGVFYLTHVWSTTNRTIQLIKNGRTYFLITVIHSFFDPLQGFLNFLVYQRPRYVRVQKACPELGRWDALKMTLMFTVVGGEDVIRRRSPAPPVQPNSRWWHFVPASRQARLSSVDGLAGEFYVPAQRDRISSVSAASDIVDVAKRPENLSVVAEDSAELSTSERQGKDERLEKLSSVLSSKRDSECETNATPRDDKKEPETGAGESSGDTTSDESNREDGQ